MIDDAIPHDQEVPPARMALEDFRRKQILVRRILGYRRVLRAINRLRKRFGRPVLGPPPMQSGKDKSSGGAS